MFGIVGNICRFFYGIEISLSYSMWWIFINILGFFIEFFELILRTVLGIWFFKKINLKCGYLYVLCFEGVS